MALYVCRGCKAWKVGDCWSSFVGACQRDEGPVRDPGAPGCGYWLAQRSGRVECPWHHGVPCTRRNLEACADAEAAVTGKHRFGKELQITLWA